jgi:CubicO group peptidase (beta-lactamase class C family)
VTRREFLGTTAAGAIGMTTISSTCAQQEHGIARAELQAMRDTAGAFTAKYGVPGLSVAFAKDDRLIYSDSFGLADPESGAPVTRASRFRIASISKPITAVAIYLLVEQGQVKLGDTVFGPAGILGSLDAKKPLGPFIEEITVEHLLTHTAGGWSNNEHDPMFKRTRLDHRSLISWTLDTMPLEHRPGLNYAYSNFGYCVLGRVIEKASGQSYSANILESIAKPCGITSWSIAGNSLAARQKNEVRYVSNDDGNPYRLPVSRMDSHGGWISSADDLLRFAVRVNGMGSRKDILPNRSIESMTTPCAANPKYAKGWAVNESHNWWHMGSLPGTTTILVRTSGGFCWTALTNTRRPGTEMAQDLDRLMWDIQHKVRKWPAGDLF